MIKVVVFDIGGVLIDDPAFGMISYYSKSLNVTKERFMEAFGKYEESWVKGRITEEELWKRISADLNVIKPKVESLWLEGFLSTYKEKEKMISLVSSLKRSEYKLGLLSNTETPVVHHIRKKFWSGLDSCIYSCEVDMVKPEREIYEALLSVLETKPDEVIFIDDVVENVDVANDIGIHGILFKNPGQVIDVLHKKGLSIQLSE